jgi:FKBP-type peptidyl-prolyl cis-trans isomerase FkpA
MQTPGPPGVLLTEPSVDMMTSTFRSIVRVASLCAVMSLAACSEDLDPGSGGNTPSDPATDSYASSLGVNLSAMTKKSDALYVQDLAVGTGVEAANGKTIGMTYTGWLVNGTRFDGNVGGAPFSFVLGTGYVIDGWDQGIVGMKIGGRRRLVIGSLLGYGSRGSLPAIPPNATLVFDVELKSVQ